MTKIKNRKIIIVIAIFLLGLAVSYGFFTFNRGSQAALTAGGKGIPVVVMHVKKEQIHLQEELPGRIVAYQSAEIRPQVTGIITQRLFEEGSFVKEGQQLYQIDPASYQAAYNSAKADIAKAEANVKSLQAKTDRYAELVKIEAVSKQEFDDITAQLAQAQADVAIAKATMETAKINVNYTKVYAPISGQIGKSEITKGALVTANQPTAIARITQLDPLYVDLTVSSEQLAKIRPAMQEKREMPVSLFLDTKDNAYPYAGKLQFTDVTVDTSTGSVMLRTIFPNPEKELLPGLFVRAVIKIEEVEGILIPQQAAIRTPTGEVNLWVVNSENKANPTPVTLGRAIGDKWLVKSGISNDDVIVLEGFQKLSPGAVVVAAPNEKAADKPAVKGGK